MFNTFNLLNLIDKYMMTTKNYYFLSAYTTYIIMKIVQYSIGFFVSSYKLHKIIFAVSFSISAREIGEILWKKNSRAMQICTKLYVVQENTVSGNTISAEQLWTPFMKRRIAYER